VPCCRVLAQQVLSKVTDGSGRGAVSAKSCMLGYSFSGRLSMLRTG
jgi:hypothetical protein